MKRIEVLGVVSREVEFVTLLGLVPVPLSDIRADMGLHYTGLRDVIKRAESHGYEFRRGDGTICHLKSSYEKSKRCYRRPVLAFNRAREWEAARLRAVEWFRGQM